MIVMEKAFAKFYKTVRALIKQNIPALYKDFKEENIEEVWVDHDNWNGGMDFYNIVISISIETYSTITAKTSISEVEKEVFGYFSDAMRGSDGSVQLRGVAIHPAEDESDDDVSNFNYNDSMWQPNYFRLFISHLSSYKKSAANLKACLLKYGIHSFVAHEDIKPSKEWEIEIENALFSMNALCAIVTKEFIQSEWCDQEIGFALGQKKVVIPIIKDAMPYGFFGKYQAIKSAEGKASEIAKSVWDTITKNEKTNSRYFSCLVSLILTAQNKPEAICFLDVLDQCSNVSRGAVDSLYKNWINNTILNDLSIIEKANNIFSKYSIKPLSVTKNSYTLISDDDLPF